MTNLMTEEKVSTPKEQLFKRYDLQDEEDFEIETLEEMREWLADFWENNPNEDMDEEDVNELIEEIKCADENEMFERLSGIDYSFDRLDEDGNAIESVCEEPTNFNIDEKLILSRVIGKPQEDFKYWSDGTWTVGYIDTKEYIFSKIKTNKYMGYLGEFNGVYLYYN